MTTTTVRDATQATFDDIVLNSKTPVVVDFWAPWCVWCRKLAPLYDELSGNHAGRLTFVKVNVETERDLAQRYGVSSLPTLKYSLGAHKRPRSFTRGRPAKPASTLHAGARSSKREVLADRQAAALGRPQPSGYA
jgi:thioredoxin 1